MATLAEQQWQIRTASVAAQQSTPLCDEYTGQAQQAWEILQGRCDRNRWQYQQFSPVFLGADTISDPDRDFGLLLLGQNSQFGTEEPKVLATDRCTATLLLDTGAFSIPVTLGTNQFMWIKIYRLDLTGSLPFYHTNGASLDMPRWYRAQCSTSGYTIQTPLVSQIAHGTAGVPEVDTVVTQNSHWGDDIAMFTVLFLSNFQDWTNDQYFATYPPYHTVDVDPPPQLNVFDEVDDAAAHSQYMANHLVKTNLMNGSHQPTVFQASVVIHLA